MIGPIRSAVELIIPERKEAWSRGVRDTAWEERACQGTPQA